MRKIIVFISIIFISSLLSAQLQGWMTITDGDGNKYYIDGSLNVRAQDHPEYEYKAVSKEGINYYLKHAVELYENSYKTEALGILKSILVLSDNQKGLHRYSVQSAKEIQKIKRKEGSRFKKLDIDSSIILYRIEKKYYFYHSFSGIAFSSTKQIKVLKKKYYSRGKYSRDGVLLAIFDEDEKKNNLLISITSEIFHYNFKNIDDYMILVKNKVSLPKDVKEVSKNNNYFMGYTNYDNENSLFSGHEFYFINGSNGNYLRTIFPVKDKDMSEEESIKILNEIVED